MKFFYLISIILGCAFQNIIRKPYTQKTSGKGVYFFSLLSSLAAMLFFIITSNGFAWNKGLVIYSAIFALSYITGTVFSLAAVAYGSLSLTALMISYSLLLPTVYGLIFLDDPIGLGLLPGLILLLVSLFLINSKSADTPLTPKWIICVFLAFIGNGMCSVIQKAQQTAFNGDFKNEFMILALLMVVLLLSVFVVIKERKETKAFAKAGWHIALGSGVANGIVNLFVMILSGIMPVSLMFPMISAGGIVITFIVSKFFYKEQLTKKQFFGFVFGMISVVFLNI